MTGDWNAQIGSNNVPTWKGVVGGYSIGATNEREEKALEFAERNKLVIANTLFKDRRSRIVTWHAPNGQSYHIDFIMVSNKLKSCIQKKGSRTFPGADVGSDHYLVMMTIKIKLLKKRKEKAVYQVRR